MRLIFNQGLCSIPYEMSVIKAQRSKRISDWDVIAICYGETYILKTFYTQSDCIDFMEEIDAIAERGKRSSYEID